MYKLGYDHIMYGELKLEMQKKYPAIVNEVQAIIDRIPTKEATWVAFMLRKITLYDFMRQRELIEVYR